MNRNPLCILCDSIVKIKFHKINVFIGWKVQACEGLCLLNGAVAQVVSSHWTENPGIVVRFHFAPQK